MYGIISGFYTISKSYRIASILIFSIVEYSVAFLRFNGIL